MFPLIKIKELKKKHLNSFAKHDQNQCQTVLLYTGHRLFLSFTWFSIMCMSQSMVCVCEWRCLGKRDALRALVGGCLTWVLGTKLGSSARAARVLHHLAIFPVSICWLSFTFWIKLFIGERTDLTWLYSEHLGQYLPGRWFCGQATPTFPFMSFLLSCKWQVFIRRLSWEGKYVKVAFYKLYEV